jgi:hypothetical protein
MMRVVDARSAPAGGSCAGRQAAARQIGSDRTVDVRIGDSLADGCTGSQHTPAIADVDCLSRRREL